MNMKRIVFLLLLFLGGMTIGTESIRAKVAATTIAAELSSPTFATPFSNKIAPITNFGGKTRPFAVRDNFVYALTGASLSIIDLSNPVVPQLASSLPLPRPVAHATRAGQYVYVVYGAGSYSSKGLWVFDVSNPYQPLLAGEVLLSTGDLFRSVHDIMIVNDYVYILHGGLVIVDVSDPRHPSMIQRIVPKHGATAFARDGDSLYTATYIITCSVSVCGPEAFMHEFDISNPDQPVQTGSSELGSVRVSDIAVNNQTLYLNSGVIYDISNVNEPVESGYLEGTSSIEIVGDYLVTVSASADEGLRIFAVTDPTNPIETGTLSIAGYEELFVGNDVAYLGGENGDMAFVDISDPTLPVLVGSHSMPGSVRDNIIADQFAYTVGLDGFTIVNISNIKRPFTVEKVVAGDVRAAAVKDGRAYLVQERQLSVFDVTAPGQSMQLGAVQLPDHNETASMAMEVVGEHAFVATRWGGAQNTGVAFWVYDVSDPSSPTVLNNFEWTTPAYGLLVKDLLVKDGYAYVVTASGFTILDVSDVANIAAVGIFEIFDTDPAAKPLDIEVENSIVYLAAFTGGLYVLDVTDPAAPELLQHGQTFGAIWTVDVDDRFLYLSASLESDNNPNPLWEAYDEHALWILDRQELSRVLSHHELPLGPTEATVRNDDIFVASQEYGTFVLRQLPNHTFLPVQANQRPGQSGVR